MTALTAPYLVVSPTTTVPGGTFDVDGYNFDSKAKYDLATFDANGDESGRADATMSAAQDRPDHSGHFHTGIFAPPVEGPAQIRAYQRGVLVATANVTVAKVVVPPPPPPPPPAVNTVTVTSVPALLSNLSNNALDEIVVANATYTIRGAGFQAANSLWIGAAGRTRPITVRAQTPGGVIFDGGGSSLGGISFEEGAHHQTWDGFTFANGVVTSTGCITFGGYDGLAGAHDITLRNITIASSIRGGGATDNNELDHAVYFAQANGGVHDVLFENVAIDCTGGLDSGFHFYFHDQGPAVAAYNVTVRGFSIKGAAKAVMMWQYMHDVRFEDGTITASRKSAINYEHPTTGNALVNVTSTGSGQTGLEAPNGTSGLTLTGCSLQ